MKQLSVFESEQVTGGAAAGFEPWIHLDMEYEDWVGNPESERLFIEWLNSRARKY